MFRLWSWFKLVRKDLVLLFFAWRNPATPRYLKVMLWMALGYLISPIDFVPDYLPVIGLVDDMTIVPALLYSISHLLPPTVRYESEQRVAKLENKLPYIVPIIVIVLVVWLSFLVWCVYALFFKN